MAVASGRLHDEDLTPLWREKNMKRTTLSIILAASMGLGLAACKSTDSMGNTSGTSASGSMNSGSGAMTERGNPTTGATGSTPTTGSTGITSGAGAWGNGTAGAAGTTGTSGTSTGSTSGTGR
jgi:hypothetical protein